ncbi:MAG TPA: prenyltransferase/squalene oxidase repeat-containing protein, partial [Rhodothermales bacterium]|nr:prenyltransferase/squalene oxidase repeat-containing protein [Rhodothermales bacterium]
MKKITRLPLLVAGLGVALTVAAFVSHPVDYPQEADPGVTLTGEVPAFVARGLDWLAAAQFDNGGWGAGTHANQGIRDPHAVQIDPATTAFSAMALLRSGSTLTDGPYHDNVRRALDYLLGMVETYPEEGSKISNISGTQPQAKLGQNIDVAMTAQFLTQVLPHTKHDKILRNRVGDALETCITKLSRAQDADGSWNSQGGWAGVLQSAMANNALEMADGAGLNVDKDALERSRRYQQNNIDATSGAVRTESAAGISLYSIASAQRATAKEAQALDEEVVSAAKEGRLKDATVSEENLQQLGYEA